MIRLSIDEGSPVEVKKKPKEAPALQSIRAGDVFAGQHVFID
jgi:hypothetical protein